MEETKAIPATGTIVAKKSKMDRTKMTEDEKKAETTRQNTKRKIRRQQEILQEKKDIQNRNRMREHRLVIVKRLCTLLNLDMNNSGCETLAKELKAEPEAPMPDEDLEDYNASDFDSSESEGEDDNVAGDETDDEVDEEERQLFKITPWTPKKYENLLISLGFEGTLDKVIIQGVDASMSIVLRKIMDDEFKHAISEQKMTIPMESKYSKKYVEIMKLYCEMHQGCRQVYKVERPMNNNVANGTHASILESCIPIELMTADAKALGYPIGRQ